MPRTVKQGPGISTPRPAPGDLRRVQDFLDTRDVVAGQDQLASPALLADWMASEGLLPIDAELSTADLKRVLAFRESLRALVLARGRPKMQTVESVNRAAKGARVEVRLGPDGAPRLDARVSSLDDSFGRWMSILVQAHLEGTWKRLSICTNPDCRRTFYDDSRSHARRWCTKHCGDAVRARAYRRSARYRRRKGRSRWP